MYSTRINFRIKTHHVFSFLGIKTFTFFAPTDRAFATLSPDVVSKTVSDKKSARELVLRHIIPGTLYTNGMTYYQIKDSLDQDKQITISKSAGKWTYLFSVYFCLLFLSCNHNLRYKRNTLLYLILDR